MSADTAAKPRTKKPVPPHLQEPKALGKIGTIMDALSDGAKSRTVAWIVEHYGTKA